MAILGDMAQRPAQQAKPLNRALAKAVKVAGGQTALAKAIGRRQPTVREWLFETGRVSAEDAVAIEVATGVPAELINAALADFSAMRGLEVRGRA